MNPYVLLADMSAALLKQILENLTKSNAPAEVIDAVQAAIDKVSAHWNDVISKQALEDQRG